MRFKPNMTVVQVESKETAKIINFEDSQFQVQKDNGSIVVVNEVFMPYQYEELSLRNIFAVTFTKIKNFITQ